MGAGIFNSLYTDRVRVSQRMWFSDVSILRRRTAIFRLMSSLRERVFTATLKRQPLSTFLFLEAPGVIFTV